MHIAHHPIFIALASITAWLGAWTALDLFRRVRAHVGGWQLAWLAAAAIAMGLSIWSMHFIAMLGFEPGAEVRYEAGRTVLSLLLAIAATAFAFFSARGQGIRREILGGVVMGAGISTMHYVGMSAVITGVSLENEPLFGVLSFLVAVTASTGALVVARKETTVLQRVMAAVVLASAIVGMHYTAMAGVRVLGPVSNVESVGIDSVVLAIAVASGTLFTLLLALIAALSDSRFEAVALREASRSEQQLRAILDNLPIGVFVLASPSGEIRFANDEATRLLGQPLEGEALWARSGSQGAIDATGQRLAPEEHVMYRAVHELRRVGPELRTYRRPDGRMLQLEVTAAPIQDRTDAGSLVVSAFQDVTAKLLAEEQARVQRDLQQVNELLEQRVAAALVEKADAEAALRHAQRLEAVGRLTGGVAHDFNNLLTVIIGALDVILRQPDNAARRTRLAEAALSAARRGERLTAQLLAFARRQPLQPETRDLNELIRECEPLLRRATAEGRALTVRLCPDRVIARIDPTQFEATLLNLIVNAVDASSAGGEIVVETQRRAVAAGELPNLAPGDYFCMAVADCGQGITAEVLGHIFEPFFTTKPAGKGTGLGLSQVYGFVKQSGGEIDVRSTPGEGTCFRIFLPISPAQMIRPNLGKEGPGRCVAALTILLAEDDPSVAAVTEAMLVDLGHKVYRTANAHEALQILWSEAEIDLLLSDLVMPGGITGVELAKQATALRPRLKVLLTSGFGGESLDAVLAQGAWPFLRKPYSSGDLAETLAGLAVPPGQALRQLP